MDVQKLTMDKDQARALYEEYRANSAYQTKDDQAIAAIYKRISQGKLVIRALASITAAGLNDDGMPKLAIMRADEHECHLTMFRDTAVFYAQHSRAKDRRFEVPLPGAKRIDWSDARRYNAKAAVPLIPVHLRPRKAIEKYFVLWEAEWFKYPVDPYLLRRCGEDAWIVVAAWELTAVERAVMSSRLNA